MIGERIKRLRDERKWSQQRLADEMKPFGATVSRAAIAQWESGSSKGLKPENLIAVSYALDKTPEEITFGEKMAPRKTNETELDHQSAVFLDVDKLQDALDQVIRANDELPEDTRKLAYVLGYIYAGLMIGEQKSDRERIKSILDRPLQGERQSDRVEHAQQGTREKGHG